METAKIRMKIGEHEFEAEGAPEAVQAQLETFKSLLSASATVQQPLSKPEPLALPAPSGDSSHVSLERIVRVQGRIVSLTAIPAQESDSALLIMLGNRDMRNNESVTGMEIGEAMAQSGQPVTRVDRVMEKLISDAFVLKSGFRRAVRYRLSNKGHQKALNVARELIASLP